VIGTGVSVPYDQEQEYPEPKQEDEIGHFEEP
jgi:hypothetical protein